MLGRGLHHGLLDLLGDRSAGHIYEVFGDSDSINKMVEDPNSNIPKPFTPSSSLARVYLSRRNAADG